jgi:hypothetical protein
MNFSLRKKIANILLKAIDELEQNKKETEIGDILDIDDIDLDAVFSLIKNREEIEPKFIEYNKTVYPQDITALKFINSLAQLAKINFENLNGIKYSHFEYIYGIPILVMSEKQRQHCFGKVNFRGLHASTLGIFVQDTKEGDTTLTHEFIHALCGYLKSTGVFPMVKNRLGQPIYPNLNRLRDEIPAYLLSCPGKLASIDEDRIHLALTGSSHDDLKKLNIYDGIIEIIKVAKLVDKGNAKIGRKQLCAICWKFADVNSILKECIRIANLNK